MSADPRVTGERVLAALDAGRQRAIAQAQTQGAVTVRLVRQALDVDVLEQRQPRGRAGRIAERLRGRVGRRQVQRILDSLSSVSRAL